MTVKQGPPPQERRVPLSVVLMTIGCILLVTIAAVWVLVPSLMPPGLYTAVSSYLPKPSILPTRIPVAAAPTSVPTPAPTATKAQTEIVVPGVDDETADLENMGLVNAQELIKKDPYAGWPVRIEIPAIQLDAPIDQVGLTPIQGADGVTYYQWQVPDAYQAGWHFNSAMLGEPGNTVLNGHHNVYGEVFRDLVDLETGDEVILYDRNRAYHYVVTDKEILEERGQPLAVRLENAKWIQATDDERVTLITCWPYTDNSHRLVVVARPVEVDN
ncbi:MAG: sortase [Candidatus Promineifilaceae bacterium]